MSWIDDMTKQRREIKQVKFNSDGERNAYINKAKQLESEANCYTINEVFHNRACRIKNRCGKVNNR